MTPMKDVLQSFAGLDESLRRSHPSMSEEYNPALVRVADGTSIAGDLEFLLTQYSLLPAMIVEFLSTGARRLWEWPDVKIELERNISEEKGSRTDKISHYSILKEALLKEINLDISDVEGSAETHKFLNSIRIGLNNEEPCFVAGVIYGLEASAIPELSIVAKLINSYAELAGLNPPINFSQMVGRGTNLKTDILGHDKYSLNIFFASHLWDFEVGHKRGLASTLTPYIAGNVQAF